MIWKGGRLQVNSRKFAAGFHAIIVVFDLLEYAMLRHLVVPAVVLAFTSHSSASAAETAAPTAAGLDVAGMDRTVKPGDDFFAYANGGWLARTEIPADRSGWGTSPILQELTAKRLAELIQDAAAHAPAGTDARKVGDFYAAFLDEAAIESKGLAPLQPALARIAAIEDARGLARELGGSIRADVDAFNSTNFETPNLFGLWVAQDVVDPTRYAPFLMQGGLGMPNRSYYVDPAPRMAEYRAKYEAHLARMLELAQQPDAAAKAARVVALETRFAEAHATREENVDVQRAKNHWARAELDTRAPGLDWTAFFDAAGLGTQKEFVVWQPEAFTGISAAVKAVPLATWKDWLTVRAIERAARVLPKAFADESFAFHGTTLAGTPVQPERWKRAVTATNQAMGEGVGRLYVEKYFPASEKQRAAKMVAGIMAAFDRRLDRLEWMTAATKRKAKAKLAVLKVGVGYPDSWLDYAALEVVKGDAFGNAERAELFEYRRNVAKLGKPVDRAEWAMDAQVVNAVNLPAMNAMNFPAAILQPPYFDSRRPEVMDYGAIGGIMGHEICHSFDDQGAQFDAAGRLENWWTAEDAEHFQRSAARLVDQYNAYKPFPDLAVNGKLTLSENMADLAGLLAAYDAYRAAYGGQEAPTVQGLTGDQQFFVSYAQMRRSKSREATARRRILTDGHAPNEYRASTVRNLDAWYGAFGSQAGDKLHLPPADRVRIW